MLSLALAVVEAARELRPGAHALVPGMWRLTCEPRLMAQAIKHLGEALAAFDKASGRQSDPSFLLKGMLAEAMMSGVDVKALVEDVDAAIALNQTPDLRPRPGDLGPPDDHLDQPVGQQNPEPRGRPKVALAPKYEPPVVDLVEVTTPDGRKELVSAALLTLLLSSGSGSPPSFDPSDPSPYAPSPVIDPARLPLIGSEDAALAHDGDTIADFGEELDAIEDRLEAAAHRIGLTPRIRQLMGAWRHARERMAMDDGPGGKVFRVPAAALQAIATINADIAAIERNPELAMDLEDEGPAPRP